MFDNTYAAPRAVGWIIYGELIGYPRENDHINIGVWKIGVEIEIFALSILRIENDGI